MTRLISILALLFIVAGCASFRPVAPGTPAITLASTEERAIRMGAKVTLPAGDYVPDFASEDGTFYLAPSSVMVRSLGLTMPFRGGLFVPNATNKSQKQSAWVQHGPSLLTGGVFGGSPVMEIYGLDEPIKFSLKR